MKVRHRIDEDAMEAEGDAAFLAWAVGAFHELLIQVRTRALLNREQILERVRNAKLVEIDERLSELRRDLRHFR